MVISWMAVELADLRSALENGISPVAGAEGDAAVLLAVCIDAVEKPSLILTRRAEKLRSHPGEVAFPGGHREPADPTLAHTALRESSEEIGLPTSAVQLLGRLPALSTRFDTCVVPFVGIIRQQLQWQLDHSEVESVFSVELDYLCAENLCADRYEIDRKVRILPRFEYADYDIWGFTAMLISIFCRRCLGRELDARRVPVERIRHRSETGEIIRARQRWQR